MKKITFFILLLGLISSSYGQYRWEVSAGATSSNLSLDTIDTERGTGFFINAGYGHLMGVRAKTSFVFSLDLLQRNSQLNNVDLKIIQAGITPKFRYLTGRGKNRFRAFFNVGPSFRVNANVKIDGIEVDSENFENVVIGGVYGAGFSQMIGEMFDIMFEIGAMNDFVDNFNDQFIPGESKFFDIYARLGLRFRVYDARR